MYIEGIDIKDIEFGEPIEEREGTFFDGYRYGLYKAHNIIDKQQKEIERLNNIINELEDYICVIEYDERHSDSWQIPVRIHNKLKELKGGNK